jgi:hypothetical protein
MVDISSVEDQTLRKAPVSPQKKSRSIVPRGSFSLSSIDLAMYQFFLYHFFHLHFIIMFPVLKAAG